MKIFEHIILSALSVLNMAAEGYISFFVKLTGFEPAGIVLSLFCVAPICFIILFLTNKVTEIIRYSIRTYLLLHPLRREIKNLYRKRKKEILNSKRNSKNTQKFR